MIPLNCEWGYLTSKRRFVDHAPGLPAPSFARTRHHIFLAGSVLIENVDRVTVWLATRGDENVSESSIWMV